MSSLNPNTRAFLFDVFGTCVDWRYSVTNELYETCQKTLADSSQQISPGVRSKASTLDKAGWGDIAQQWRTTYYKYTRELANDPNMKFKTVDQHHLDSLLDILHEHGLTSSPDPSVLTQSSPQSENLYTLDQIKDLSFVWHRLVSWPDTNEGLQLLGSKYVTATLSNGNISLLRDMQEYSGMKFTETLSSELFGSYKPNPAIYHGAAKRLGLKEEQCVMVAAHLGDLKAAKGCGFSTVYVERPQEETYDIESAKKEGFVDYWIKEGESGFVKLAKGLGL